MTIDMYRKGVIDINGAVTNNLQFNQDFSDQAAGNKKAGKIDPKQLSAGKKGKFLTETSESDFRKVLSNLKQDGEQEITPEALDSEEAALLLQLLVMPEDQLNQLLKGLNTEELQGLQQLMETSFDSLVKQLMRDDLLASRLNQEQLSSLKVEWEQLKLDFDAIAGQELDVKGTEKQQSTLYDIFTALVSGENPEQLTRKISRLPSDEKQQLIMMLQDKQQLVSELAGARNSEFRMMLNQGFEQELTTEEKQQLLSIVEKSMDSRQLARRLHNLDSEAQARIRNLLEKYDSLDLEKLQGSDSQTRIEQRFSQLKEILIRSVTDFKETNEGQSVPEKDSTLIEELVRLFKDRSQNRTGLAREGENGFELNREQAEYSSLENPGGDRGFQNGFSFNQGQTAGNSGNNRGIILEQLVSGNNQLNNGRPTDIVDQVIQKFELQQSTGKQTLEMQLEPEFLGKIRVNLEMKSGELTARLLVENLFVREHLDQNLASLKAGLQRQGYEVDNITVETEDHNPGGDNGSPRGQGHDWRYQQDSQQRPYQQLPESLRQQLEELSGEELESTPWMVNRDMLYNYYYRRMNLLA